MLRLGEGEGEREQEKERIARRKAKKGITMIKRIHVPFNISSLSTLSTSVRFKNTLKRFNATRTSGEERGKGRGGRRGGGRLD